MGALASNPAPSSNVCPFGEVQTQGSPIEAAGGHAMIWFDLSRAEFQRLAYSARLLTQLADSPELDASLEVLLELQRRNPHADPILLADVLRQATARYRTDAPSPLRSTGSRDEVLAAYLDALRQVPARTNFVLANLSLLNSLVTRAQAPSEEPQADMIHSGSQRLLGSEGEWVCQAYVPALGIAVLAETAEALDERLPRHIRLALQRTRASTSLRALAVLQRCGELRVLPLSLRVNLRTPKQAAVQAHSQDKVKRAVLPEVAVDLTKAKLAPAFEAEKVVLELAEALGGSPPGSVLLVGASGVGKTAAWHELVRRRAEFQFGETPFWATSGSRLVAGMTGIGMWQERCQQVVREASKTRAVVHLGGLSELMQVGRSVHNREGIASLLRPALGRGERLAVVECPPEHLPSIERQDPHLEPRSRETGADGFRSGHRALVRKRSPHFFPARVLQPPRCRRGVSTPGCRGDRAHHTPGCDARCRLAW